MGKTHKAILGGEAMNYTRIAVMLLVLCLTIFPSVSAIEENTLISENVTIDKGDNEYKFSQGDVELKHKATGLKVKTSPIINGQKFVPSVTSPSQDSITWTSGETAYYVIPDPDISMLQEIKQNRLKETITIKSDKELSFDVDIPDGMELVPWTNGRFKLIYSGGLTGNGVILEKPYGFDAAGKYIDMEYSWDGSTLGLVYNRSSFETRKTEQGDTIFYESIRYPLKIDPTWTSVSSHWYGTNSSTGQTFVYEMWNQSGSYNWTAPAGVSSVQYLIVGGGGGGGSQYGGGGAGGVAANSSAFSVTPGTSYPVIVGSGGDGGIPTVRSAGSNGTISRFSTVTAGMGNGGAGYTFRGFNNSPGNGGGGNGYSPTIFLPGTKTVTNTYPGGYGEGTTPVFGGGGGAGAGSPGISATTASMGNGGIGLPSGITDSVNYYGSGGGGASANFNVGTLGFGGSSCAGNGSNTTVGGNAVNSTGCGGGAGGYTGAAYARGGMGAEGLVVLKYLTPTTITANFTMVNVSAPATATATRITGNVPFRVAFTNTSIGPNQTSFVWTAQEQGTGSIITFNTTSANPIYQFSNATNHLIRVNASGPTGANTSTFRAWVNLTDLGPHAGFIASPLSGSPALLVAFTDNTTTNAAAATYNWSFADSSGTDPYDDTVGDVSHVYGYGGVFTPSLTVTTVNGTSTFIGSPIVVSSSQSQVWSSPAYITFHVKEAWGTPVSGVNISMTPVSTSTGSWDWIALLTGVPLDEVPIGTTELYQTTDDGGTATFYAIPTAKYNVTFTKTGYTITPQVMVPDEKDYIIWATAIEQSFYTSGYNQLEQVNITVLQTPINETATTVRVIYNDALGHTTGGYIDVLQDSSTPGQPQTLLHRFPAVSSSYDNSTVITHSDRISGQVFVNATHTDFGYVKRTFTFSYEGPAVKLLNFTPDVTMLIAFGLIFITIMSGGTLVGRPMAVVAVFEMWLFYFWGWFDPMYDRGMATQTSLVLAIVIATVIAIAANMEIRKKKEKY